MSNTIDMQLMRYINLFERVARVSTKNCFVYNNFIIFAVPPKKVSLAVGKNGANVRKLGEILRKKIKVVPMASSKEEIPKFVEDVVSPTGFNKAEVKNNEVVISAGRQNKAALIGRARAREKELKNILKNYFGIESVRIV